MADLDTFRAETRAWLEANCPPSMRAGGVAVTEDDDGSIWGGRKAKWSNPEGKLWLDRMAARGWTALKRPESAATGQPPIFNLDGVSAANPRTRASRPASRGAWRGRTSSR